MDILLDIAGYIFTAMAAIGVLMTVIGIIGIIIEITKKKEPIDGLEFIGALLPLFIAAGLFVAAFACFAAKERHLKTETKTEANEMTKAMTEITNEA